MTAARDRRRWVVALVLLGLGAVVFGRSLVGSATTLTPITATRSDDEPIAPEPSPDDAPGVDLLAIWGSFRVDQAAANPFSPSVVDGFPAAPGGAAPPPAATGDREDRPPRPLDVSLVLMAERVSRAVVDGQVVGIGDRIAAGTVHAIARTGIEVDDGRRVWFYELRTPWPRGYRPPTADAERGEESDR
jgi:hypothetical protein